MAPERIPISDRQLVMMFAASCIEWVAAILDRDYLEIFSRMDKAGIIEEYIIKHYDTLHLESREHISGELIDLLLERETSAHKTGLQIV
ncbi:MAG: DUF3791 domain-containing protein [Muribaculaceae bacterium]|nr:DUF3791 domain-containing protein [Muribaculaceae bacterium]